MKIKQSLAYPIMKPDAMPLDEFCREARQIGYEALDLWFRGPDFEEVVETARKHRMVIASMCGHGTHTEGLSRADQHERIEGELKESIDIAKRCGIPSVIGLSGNRNDGESDCEGLVTCAKGLRRIVRHAEEAGININMEILNSKVDHPRYLCDRTDLAVTLCELVNSPRFKILFDVYHVQIMEGDVIRNFQKALPWIGHVHTAGNPGRNDLNDTQELNYAGICRAIAATSYDGYVAHEYRPNGDLWASLRQAFTTCNVG
jgi:hydroxypyruvate isomerase